LTPVFTPAAALLAAINHHDKLEQVERCSSLADLIQDGEVSAIYDVDHFVAILDRYRSDELRPSSDNPLPRIPQVKLAAPAHHSGVR
jgi:hypothetical protein